MPTNGLSALAGQRRSWGDRFDQQIVEPYLAESRQGDGQRERPGPWHVAIQHKLPPLGRGADPLGQRLAADRVIIITPSRLPVMAFAIRNQPEIRSQVPLSTGTPGLVIHSGGDSMSPVPRSTVDHAASRKQPRFCRSARVWLDSSAFD